MRRITAAFWGAAFLFSLCTLEFFNDHFHRISLARQIAQYGELPFRDFFDPGYFLTELSSAAMQRLFGDNLLGELLFNSIFIATGCTLVLILACRAGSSLVVGFAAAVMALLSMPRAYDYDKVLFYPFGLWLCWRYVDRHNTRRVIVLGVAIAVAALFRYDTGVYLTLAAAVCIGVMRRHTPPLAARDAATLGMAIVVTLSPALLFVQMNGGLGNAVDQIITYGVRESEPLHIVVIDPAPLRNQVHIRWSPVVDGETRRRRAASHSLRREEQLGPPQDRTFSYELSDTARDVIRAIVNDPLVEDTHLINRATFELSREPFAARLRRAVPLLRMRMRSDMYDSRAAALLYYIIVALPVVAGILLLARRGSDVDGARLWSLVVLCVVLNVFILRAPMAARVGGMAGIPLVIGAWLLRRSWGAGMLWRAVAVVVLAGIVWGLAVVGEWPRRLTLATFAPHRLGAKLAAVAASPPDAAEFGDARSAALVRYAHQCTTSTDRLFATWYVPELFFFAQRPFAGRMAPVFAQHWSETRFQLRSIEALKNQSVPLVFIESKTYAEFAAARPLIDTYLRDQYIAGGETVFGEEKSAYRILVRKDRAGSARQQPESGLPCFT